MEKKEKKMKGILTMKKEEKIVDEQRKYKPQCKEGVDVFWC